MEQFFEWVMEGYPARWYCGSWSELVGWSYILGNLLTFTAYITIPGVLIYVLRKKPSIPIPSIGYLFAAFILSCGITHLVDTIIFWYPVYPLQAFLLLMTGFISWATVLAVKQKLPEILELPEQHATLVQKSEKDKELYTTKLESANKRLHQLLYAASHDLKEPARNIRGYLHLIEMDAPQLSDEQQGYYEEIQNSANRIYDMLDDILQFSLLAKHDNTITLIDTTKMVKELVKEVENADFTIETLPSITADEFHIQQVFRNLIKNADKYRKPESKLQLKITSEVDDTYYTFKVTDNGIGIDPDYSEEIFKMFRQIDSRKPGNGIGLALVKEIIESYQGNIWVESELDKGSTFAFTIKKALDNDQT